MPRENPHKHTLDLPNRAGDWGLAYWCRGQGGGLVYIKLPPIPRICPSHHDRTIALERASCWAGGSDAPTSEQHLASNNNLTRRPLLPRAGSALAEQAPTLTYGCLLGPIWARLPSGSCYQRCKETSEECAQARYHLLRGSSIFT